MKTTKHHLFFLTVILLLSGIPGHLQASHLEGMQLTYSHLSGSTYRFSLAWYRDCSFVVAPLTSIPMHITSLSCGVNQVLTLNLDTSQTKVITLICPYDTSTCDGGTAPGFERLFYENDITLSGQCYDWLFEVSYGGRNAAITTLQNPGGDDLYVAAQLNNSSSDNNSPRFTNEPIIFECIDQDFHYNPGMYDADGDSISYQMIAPRTAANTSVVYLFGYSVINPLSSSPPVSFNDFTGDLYMHPLNAEVAVIAYEIKDWRNGELMGSVIRDIIVYTIPCGNNPTATGMNGSSQQFLYVFPDDTVCFDVFSDDVDANDTVTMTWNQTIPNATFVTNGTPHPTGTFCWTPTQFDVRSQPYMFTAMVQDNTCPMNNAGVYSYFIYVTQDSSLVWAGITKIDQPLTFTVYPNPSSGLFTLKSDFPFSEIKIYNYTGECIREKISDRIVDLISEPPGIYFLEVSTANGKRSLQKILKTSSE